MALPTTDMAGHSALRDRVQAALDRVVESPDIDFKQSAPWEALKWKIVRAVLGMGNLREGGMVIIGVSERDQVWELEGISQEHLDTYDADALHDLLDRHVSPAAKVDMVLHEAAGKRYLVIYSHEFEELPYVCKRNGEGLEEGVVYTRPASGRPRTERVHSADDMRDLLSLAAEKGARRIIEQSRRIGVLEIAPQPDAEVLDRQRYDEELEGL